MTNDERDIQRKLRVLQHAEKIGNARKACRYFGVGRSSFYRWRDVYQKHGEAGCFDVVLANFGVMFFANNEEAFANIRRAIKNNGRFAATVWGMLPTIPGFLCPNVSWISLSRTCPSLIQRDLAQCGLVMFRN